MLVFLLIMNLASDYLSYTPWYLEDMYMVEVDSHSWLDMSSHACQTHAAFLYCRKRARMQCVRETRQQRKVADMDTTTPEVRYTFSN